MSVKLTAQQKATIYGCSCQLPAGLHHKPVSKKSVVVPLLVLGVILYVVWALWPTGALWLLGIYGVMVVGSFVYRLILGHSFQCSLKWSPVVALYTIGHAIASAGL